jgi:hypothetical protein
MLNLVESHISHQPIQANANDARRPWLAAPFRPLAESFCELCASNHTTFDGLLSESRPRTPTLTCDEDRPIPLGLLAIR